MNSIKRFSVIALTLTVCVFSNYGQAQIRIDENEDSLLDATLNGQVDSVVKIQRNNYVTGPRISSRNPNLSSFGYIAPAPEERLFSYLNLNFNSTDLYSFDNGVSCVKLPEDSLLKVSNDMNWNTCLDKRKADDDSGVTLPQRALLEADQDACKCLREWQPHPAVRDLMSKNVVKARAQTVPKAELEQILNGMVFQSYQIFENPKLAQNYSHNLYHRDSLSYQPNERELEKFVRDVGPYPANVCITPREFLAMNQMPHAVVIESLKGNFNEQDWNYKNLQASYINLMQMSPIERGPHAKEVVLLKEKLKFLNKNPLIKYALGSTPGEKIPKDMKSDLFKTLKSFTNPECLQIGSKCMEKYKKDLGEHFKSEDMFKLVRDEARVDHKERVERKQGDKVLTERRIDLSQRGVMNEFMAAYKLSSPDTCDKNSANSVECLEIYSGYCKTLDKYADEIADLPPKAIDPKIMDDLEDDLRDNFNTDIASNEIYQEMNKNNCDNRRSTGKIQGLLNSNNKKSFREYINSLCHSSNLAVCPKDGKIASAENLRELRNRWREAFPEAVGFLGSKNENFEVMASQKKPAMSEMTVAESTKFKSSVTETKTPEQVVADYSSVVRESYSDNGPVQNYVESNHVAEEARPAFKSEMSEVGTTGVAGGGGGDETPSFGDMNYSNFAMGNTGAGTVPEIPKVEHMNDEKRSEMLSDWQKEYSDWKTAKGDEMSPEESAKDAAMKQEIATLKQLLAQQQELSQQQYKLLNEAIAAKSKPATASSEPKADPSSEIKKAVSQIAQNAKTQQVDESEVSRGPASVKESKPTTAGAASGSSSSGNQAARRSTKSDSQESVAREEAKLVNLRRFADGSITIEPSQSGGSSQGNAITVPVSDEQYRMLQSNPTSLNLGQIEKNIPKDQIAKLEKNGEIIILLRNGSNPPFEVKVEKKDNRLVYSLKDKDGKEQAPIRRVYTRQALELQLKAQR